MRTIKKIFSVVDIVTDVSSLRVITRMIYWNTKKKTFIRFDEPGDACCTQKSTKLRTSEQTFNNTIKL